MTDDSSPQHRRTVLSAAWALDAMAAGDDAGVARHLRALRADDSADYPAIANALLVWVEMLRDHMFAGRERGAIEVVGATLIDDSARPGHNAHEYEMRGGSLIAAAPARTVPPHYEWAAQVIAARLSRDRRRFDQLWDDAPGEAGVFGKYVLAVLMICARTIAREKRGYGLSLRLL